MSFASALTAGRRAAESRMTSTATVRRPGGKTTNANGFEVDGWTTIYSALPSWVDKGRGTRKVTIGDVEMELAVRILKAPHDTNELRDGDVFQMAGGLCDGRFFRLIETTPLDQKKQQEFEVIETNEPEGWT